MKKAVIISVLCLFVSFAQARINFGVKLGANLSQWNGDDVQLMNYTLGAKNYEYPNYAIGFGGFENTGDFNYSAGVFLEYQLFSKLGVQLEALYDVQGTQFVGNAFIQGSSIKAIKQANVKQKNSYVKVPLLLEYVLFGGNKSNVSIAAGPYYAYNLSSDQNVKIWADIEEYEDKVADLTPEEMDYGVIGGVSVALTSKILLDARYQQGFAQVIDGRTIYNNAYTVQLGYAF